MMGYVLASVVVPYHQSPLKMRPLQTVIGLPPYARFSVEFDKGWRQVEIREIALSPFGLE